MLETSSACLADLMMMVMMRRWRMATTTWRTSPPQVSSVPLCVEPLLLGRRSCRSSDCPPSLMASIGLQPFYFSHLDTTSLSSAMLMLGPDFPHRNHLDLSNRLKPPPPPLGSVHVYTDSVCCWLAASPPHCRPHLLFFLSPAARHHQLSRQERENHFKFSILSEGVAKGQS